MTRHGKVRNRQNTGWSTHSWRGSAHHHNLTPHTITVSLTHCPTHPTLSHLTPSHFIHGPHTITLYTRPPHHHTHPTHYHTHISHTITLSPHTLLQPRNNTQLHICSSSNACLDNGHAEPAKHYASYLGLGMRYEAGICTIVISRKRSFN